MNVVSSAVATGLVDLQVTPPVAVVRLSDTVGRNRISRGLDLELTAAMSVAAANTEVKAIVLAGLPDVFCAGAAPDDLLGDHGQRTLGGWDFVRAAADCPLPVVAAAQGHAIGGGLLLALYADVAVFSEKSRYAANFLALGFTPCLGSTYVVPARLGAAVASEMFYTGRAMRGRELAERGVGVRVTRHDQVDATANAIAMRIAQAPRDTLTTFKRQLSAVSRAEAKVALGREVLDHQTTLASETARRTIAGLHPGAGRQPDRHDAATFEESR